MKAVKKAGVAVSMLIVLVLTAFPGGRPESAGMAEGGIIRIRGTLRLVGSEPFTRFVVTEPGGKDYFLEDISREDATPLLNSEVTVEGVLRIRELKSADNKITVTEYIITGAGLINP